VRYVRCLCDNRDVVMWDDNVPVKCGFCGRTWTLSGGKMGASVASPITSLMSTVKGATASFVKWFAGPDA
jgi:ribosomal protein S27E